MQAIVCLVWDGACLFTCSLLIYCLCRKSREKLPGATEDVPIFFTYGKAGRPAWRATRNGEEITQAMFQELFNKLKWGLQALESKLGSGKKTPVPVVVTPFQEPETHRNLDGSIDLNVRGDENFRRHMFEISLKAGKKAENHRKNFIQKRVVPLVQTGAAADDYSTSVQENQKIRGDGGGKVAWNDDGIKYLTLRVLQTWDKMHEEDVGVEHRWFLYLLDLLLGLVSAASSNLLQPNVANIMCFNSDAKLAAKPQALHLDNTPFEIYPDLFTNDGDIKYTCEELEEQIAKGISWFPRIWLYFLAFEDNHAIDIFHDPHGYCAGTDVLYIDPEHVPTEASLNGLQKRHLQRLELPFGSIAFVAGSVIHRGIGSGTEPPMDPCYRLHAFCHVNGHSRDIDATGTYILQRGEIVDKDVVDDEEMGSFSERAKKHKKID